MVHLPLDRGSCSINTGSTVVVTGGINSRTRVSEYSETSFLRSLPSLQEGRWLHGCGYYDNSDGTKVIPPTMPLWTLFYFHYGQFFIFPFPQVPPDSLKIFHLFYSFFLFFLIELIKKIF